MATVIFIHGTGAREAVYELPFARLESVLKRRRPGAQMARCYWRDPLGARFPDSVVSVPTYDTARAVQPALGSEGSVTTSEEDALISDQFGAWLRERRVPEEQISLLSAILKRLTDRGKSDAVPQTEPETGR